MDTNIHIKSIPFFGATISYIYFKNLVAIGLQDFAESMNELFYEEKLAPISVTVNGSDKAYKLWVKANQNTFEEINWITTWFNSSGNEQSISGYFTALSGPNLISLVSEQFICKVFDTVQARFCFIGEVNIPAKKITLPEEWKQLQHQFNKAIQLCGLEVGNLIKQSFLVSGSETMTSLNSLFGLNKGSNNLLTPKQLVISGNHHQTRILGSTVAIKPSNADMYIETKDIGIASQIRIGNQNLDYFQFLNAAVHSETMEKPSYELQITQTLDAVSNWIENYGLNWSHICRGIAYFNDTNGLKIFKAICKERKVPLSNILTLCLDSKTNIPLFDLEVDFIITKDR